MELEAQVTGISRSSQYPVPTGTDQAPKVLNVTLQQADGNQIYLALPDQLLPDVFAFGRVVSIKVK